MRPSISGRSGWVIAALFTVGSLGCGGPSSNQPVLGPADGEGLPPTDLERVAVGDVAPDFTLASYGGDVVTLSDFRGERKVLLVFYRGHW